MVYLSPDGTVGVLARGPMNTVSTAIIPSLGVINDGQLHQVTVTFISGGAVQIYVDGELKGSGTAPAFNLSGSPLVLGQALAQNTLTYNGELDDIGVFSQALSAAQVQTLPAQSQAQLTTLGLVALYKGKGTFAANSVEGAFAANSVGGQNASALPYFSSTTVGLDPMLAPLQYSSGPTQTMFLLPGSPAIDAGSNTLASVAGLTTDQRGFPRILNSTVDVGAVEVPSLTPGTLTPPTTVKGAPVNNVLLFHFTDPAAPTAASDYAATIAWGDGTTSTVTSSPSVGGVIVADANGFDVYGSHTYTRVVNHGVFRVQAVNPTTGAGAAGQATVSVAAAPLSAAGAVVTTWQSVAFTGVVATITSADTTLCDTATVTINWGDGSSSAGVVSGSAPATSSPAPTPIPPLAFTI